MSNVFKFGFFFVGRTFGSVVFLCCCGHCMAVTVCVLWVCLNPIGQERENGRERGDSIWEPAISICCYHAIFSHQSAYVAPLPPPLDLEWSMCSSYMYIKCKGQPKCYQKHQDFFHEGTSPEILRYSQGAAVYICNVYFRYPRVQTQAVLQFIFSKA